MKLDLEDRNVHELTLTRSEVRSYLDGDSLGEEFDLALDEAQGAAQETSPQYLVIKIEKD